MLTATGDTVALRRRTDVEPPVNSHQLRPTAARRRAAKTSLRS
jgi:hypothetical protein